VAVGGLGLCGTPADLIESVRDSNVRDLVVVSNNMGVDGKGLGLLLENRQVRKVIASYVVQVKCADQPGEAAKFGRKLADAGVNIEGLLEVSICQGEVIFAIAVDKPEDARAALSDQIVD
jgi:acyl CoA:acetate/3-ketoacid CoA transferase alpha subunit